MSELIKTKIIEDPLPEEFGGAMYFRHALEWWTFDGINAPQKHLVVGPLFKDKGSVEEQDALREFARLSEEKLREFPPCDREKVISELCQRKAQ